MESTSSHPLAIAIREFCAANTTHPQNGTSFRETAGRGLFASFQSLSCSVVIGNEYWMQENNVQISLELRDLADSWKNEAKSVVFVAAQRDAQWEVFAIFGVADLIRPEASNVISLLKKAGIETWMISGDNEKTALAVAAAVGIPSSNVIAGVLPQEKVSSLFYQIYLNTDCCDSGPKDTMVTKRTSCLTLHRH